MPSSSPQKKQVLVTGASIAGPITAYFLQKSSLCTVTILERSPNLRLNGAGVDIRGAGVKVMQHMDLEDQIRSKCTHEAGMHFVGAEGQPIGSFEAGEGELITSDIEIARGEVARVCVRRAEEAGVNFIFGDTVSAIEDDEASSKVHVTFTNSGQKHTYDLLIVADGLFSKTRDLVFGAEFCKQHFRSYNAFVTYFRIKKDADYGDEEWGRWYNTTLRRCILLRPDLDPKMTQASLCILSEEKQFKDLMRRPAEEQKQVYAQKFKDAGWQADRVIEGMMKADDFYMQEIAQIRLPKWSKGRVVLVGDAAYCPSGMSGMGTSCATVGAYVLAGELCKTPENISGALERYESLLRPYVDRAQQLPPGAPWLVNPETWWGIGIMRGVLGVVGRKGVQNVFRQVAKAWSFWSPPSDNIILPEYGFGK